MGGKVKCSVVVPTYNRVELLRYTLDSLTRQDLPKEDFEVLVVDDGSSDSTAELVPRYADRLNVRYFFQEDEGWRVAKARNVGIANAEGEICVFADTGVLLHSGCLRAHVDAYASGEAVAVCGYVYCFNIDNEDAKLINAEVDFDNPDATIETLRREQRWLDVREEFYRRYTDDFGDRVPAPWLPYWTCNASARTDQLRAVGMFDEQFRSWGSEDVDLAYRLHRDGARIVLSRDAAAIHAPHDKSFEENMRSAVLNQKYMAGKYDTPLIRMFAEDPPVMFFDFNDVAIARGLPTCAEYLARQELAG
jgi:glycosyltransferase involved in cell wall biosynthesis